MNSIDRKIMQEKVDTAKRFLTTVIQIVGKDFDLNKNFESYSKAIKGQFPFSPEACEHLNRSLHVCKKTFDEYGLDINDYVDNQFEQLITRPDAEAKTLNQIF